MDAVLVCDADPSGLDATCKLLNRLGHVACRASSVSQVQEQLTAVRIPVCLVDPRIETSVADLQSWARKLGMDTEFVPLPEHDAQVASAVARALLMARARTSAPHSEELRDELMSVMGRASLLRESLDGVGREQAALIISALDYCYRLAAPQLGRA